MDKTTGLPLSFNVMPLPQMQEQGNRPPDPYSPVYGGFILKNFAFSETIRFNGSTDRKDTPHWDPAALAAIAGAPNRGGTYTQFVHAMFYDQQVRFAEGPHEPNGTLQHPENPAMGDIVHIENGSWLHLDTQRQVLGPYRLDKHNGPFVHGKVLPRPPYITIAKQIAVPHGNSVLALGSFDSKGKYSVDKDGMFKAGNPVARLTGRPVIPDAFVPLPAPADIVVPSNTNPYERLLNNDPYDFENPNPEWTLNANKPLRLAVDMINPTSYIHWRVTTLPLVGGTGTVTNIPFEDRKSKVTQYWADYWLLSKSTCRDYNNPENLKKFSYDYLAYPQTILMEMDIFVGKPGDSIENPENHRRYVFRT